MYKLTLLFLGCCVLLLLTQVGVVHAQNEILIAGQQIDSDHVRSGQTVQIDGQINGDAFLMGGLVTVNGKIDGDLFILGGKVNVNGEVTNSIRIIGGDVTINGPVGRNVLIVCGNCTVTKEASMEGSLLAAGGNLDLAAAKIGRGFRFLGSRLYLNSAVASEAFVVADNEFILGPTASVSGDLKYTGNKEAILQPGATVAGKMVYEQASQDENFPRFFGARGLLQFYNQLKPVTDFLGFFFSLLIGFVLLGLFPTIFERVVKAVEKQPYASVGWGTIIVLIGPVAAILFALTVVGIPVSLLLIVLSYVIWVLAQYLIAFFIGRKILLPKYGERRGWAMILGLGLLYLLALIPVVGRLVQFLLTILVVGALIISYRQSPIIKSRSLKQISRKKK